VSSQFNTVCPKETHYSASSVEAVDSVEVKSDVYDEWLGMWKEGS